MRARPLLLALPVLLLTGCAAPGSVPTSTTTVTASASASPAVTVTATASATPSSSPTAAASPTQCGNDALAVSVQYDGELSGAGQRGSWVVFRNTGSIPCTLHGAPGVSVVGHGNGTQVGQPAQRDTSTGPTIEIAPGAYALALLGYPYIDKQGGAYGDGKGHDPKCEAVPIDGYRVYPPHSTRAFFSRDAGYGCSTALRWLSVGLVEPAAKARPFVPTF